MKSYLVKYTNNRGRKINAVSRGDDAMDALYRYGNRMVFGGPIFINIHIKMIDADTRGKSWATANADDLQVTVERAEKAE